jgi:periplasmic protein TonB
MPNVLHELFERPSRLIGWGVVAVIHLIAWQVLTHGLNWVKSIPVLNAVQVSLINNDPPAEMPSLPKVEQHIIKTELFVPAPEVNVAQESAMVVSATAVLSPPAVTSDIAPPSATAQSHSTNLLVVNISDADYLEMPAVRYPLASKRANERGTVLLSVLVNTHGLVEYVSIYRSSGYRRLDDAAMYAVRSMRLKPYIRNGIAMTVEVRIPVEFS